MKKLFNSFKFAFQGLWLAGKEQPNLRIHLFVSFLVVSLAFYFDVTKVEWCVLLLCIGLVISLELLNSAIEGIVDLVSPEWQVKAGKIKDIAAAAVLVSVAVSVFVGLLIFSKYFF
ncbi:MAG: diacylglycerol kinase family protein [Cytophagales bacterium]|jgi:diacylglycerol kinase|nr:diacylglycerol kinase family protein [Cytophagales bacterium]